MQYTIKPCRECDYISKSSTQCIHHFLWQVLTMIHSRILLWVCLHWDFKFKLVYRPSVSINYLIYIYFISWSCAERHGCTWFCLIWQSWKLVSNVSSSLNLKAQYNFAILQCWKIITQILQNWEFKKKKKKKAIHSFFPRPPFFFSFETGSLSSNPAPQP